jgi:hypothetical protein
MGVYHENEYVDIAGFDIRKPGGWKKKVAGGGAYFGKNSPYSEFYMSKGITTWDNAKKNCKKLKRYLASPKT